MGVPGKGVTFPVAVRLFVMNDGGKTDRGSLALSNRLVYPFNGALVSWCSIPANPSNRVVCERYGFGRVVFCRVAIPKLDPVTQHQRHGSVGRDVGGQPCDAFAKANNTLTYLQTRVQEIQNCNTKYSPLD